MVGLEGDKELGTCHHGDDLELPQFFEIEVYETIVGSALGTATASFEGDIRFFEPLPDEGQKSVEGIGEFGKQLESLDILQQPID